MASSVWRMIGHVVLLVVRRDGCCYFFELIRSVSRDRADPGVTTVIEQHDGCSACPFKDIMGPALVVVQVKPNSGVQEHFSVDCCCCTIYVLHFKDSQLPVATIGFFL